MKVTVTWGEVIDTKLFAAIKSAPWYPQEYKVDADLDNAIATRLAQTPDLKRCLGVTYDVTITKATAPEAVGLKLLPMIGADDWLLLIKE